MDADQPEIWVLGNLTIDDVVAADGVVSLNMCGGNAIYAAVGARIWSDRVGLCARVGPDYPKQHLETLRREGIRLQLTQVATPSIRNWALYEGPDTRRFIAWLSSGSHLAQSPLPDELPPSACSVPICHIAPMPLSVQQQLVHHLRRGDCMLLLDPHDEYLAGHERAVLELLALVTVFLPSRQEARLLFGRDAPEDAARAFVAAGARVAVVKLGAEGSLVCEAGRLAVHHVPAVPVTVVDPTGAGDAYCGAFGVIYSPGHDALQAALHASVAASFVVEHLGATSALPTDRHEAERRLRLLTSQLEGVTRACAWTSES
jgi:sugar/nucleoside kinase (ribokinase family)